MHTHIVPGRLGEGQFMPLAGSNAFIGEINKLEKVAEYKVEIICTEEQIRNAVTALKKAHPYETPAYRTRGAHQDYIAIELPAKRSNKIEKYLMDL